MNASNGNESGGTMDWHPADVLAALKKRGHNLAGLSATNGQCTRSAIYRIAFG